MADISLLPTVRVAALSFGARRTPVPGALGPYLEPNEVWYWVLLPALSLCPRRVRFPTLLDSGRQLPTVIQTLPLTLSGVDAGRETPGQTATWMGSLWAGLGKAEPEATAIVSKGEKEPLHPLYLSEGLNLTLGSSRAASTAPTASRKWPLKWEGKWVYNANKQRLVDQEFRERSITAHKTEFCLNHQFTLSWGHWNMLRGIQWPQTSATHSQGLLSGASTCSSSSPSQLVEVLPFSSASQP